MPQDDPNSTPGFIIGAALNKLRAGDFEPAKTKMTPKSGPVFTTRRVVKLNVVSTSTHTKGLLHR